MYTSFLIISRKDDIDWKSLLPCKIWEYKPSNLGSIQLLCKATSRMLPKWKKKIDFQFLFSRVVLLLYWINAFNCFICNPVILDYREVDHHNNDMFRCAYFFHLIWEAIIIVTWQKKPKAGKNIWQSWLFKWTQHWWATVWVGCVTLFSFHSISTNPTLLLLWSNALGSGNYLT